MQRSFALTYALIVSAVWFAGCSGGGRGSGAISSAPTEPPPITTTQSYPSDSATAAGGGTAWDITQVKTTLYGQFHSASGNAYDTLRVDVTFAQDVSNALPAPGQSLDTSGTELGMIVRIDTGSSGYYETCSESPSSAPYQYESDAGDDPSRLSDGNYSILDDVGPIYTGGPNPGAEAQTTVSGHVITQIFFLETLGVEAGPEAPDIKIGVTTFNGTFEAYPATDCVPAGSGEISAG